MKGIIMNAKFSHRMCAVVMGAALCLQASAVMAEVVSTDKMAVQNQAEAEKAKIQTFLERTDVQARLQALGVNEPMSKDRVAALNDQEIHAMAQKIDSMPAGGDLGNSNTILILVLIILLLVI